MLIEADHLIPFLVASLLVTVVPGADMALVTRQVLVRGPRLAQRTITGNLAGLTVHALALTVGLSALIVASATAYTTVKLAGAVYLCFLGVQALRAARRPRPAAVTDDPATAHVPSQGKAFVQGLVSTVLNPKPALFFLTFLPQFVDRNANVPAQTATLAALHLLVGLVWLSLYARLVHRAHHVLVRPRITRWLEATTGTVLVALGVRVAVERR